MVIGSEPGILTLDILESPVEQSQMPPSIRSEWLTVRKTTYL